MVFNADAQERGPDPRLRGMNPEFVKRVWEKRYGTKREKLRASFVPAAVVVRKPDAIDIMLKRAVEKYGAVKTPRQRIRSDVGAVAAIYGITHADITSKETTQVVVRARSAAMWMLKFSRGKTLPEIGRYFNMDHTAVLAGINRHVARLDPNDPRALWIELKRSVSRSGSYRNYQAKTDRPSKRAA